MKPETDYVRDLKARIQAASGPDRNERLVEGREKAATKRGRHMGPVPFGYTRIEVKDPGHVRGRRPAMMPNEHASWVPRLFRAYLEEGSLRRTVEWAKANGFPGSRAFGGRKMNQAYLAVILTNTFYVGFVSWRGKRYPSQHGALVSKDLFDEVQERLQKNRRGVLKPVTKEQKAECERLRGCGLKITEIARRVDLAPGTVWKILYDLARKASPESV